MFGMVNFGKFFHPEFRSGMDSCEVSLIQGLRQSCVCFVVFSVTDRSDSSGSGVGVAVSRRVSVTISSSVVISSTTSSSVSLLEVFACNSTVWGVVETAASVGCVSAGTWIITSASTSSCWFEVLLVSSESASASDTIDWSSSPSVLHEAVVSDVKEDIDSIRDLFLCSGWTIVFFGCFTGSVSHAVASNIDCCCGVVIILVRLLLLLLLLCTRTRYMVLEGNISICGGGSSKGNVVVILKIVIATSTGSCGVGHILSRTYRYWWTIVDMTLSKVFHQLPADFGSDVRWHGNFVKYVQKICRTIWFVPSPFLSYDTS